MTGMKEGAGENPFADEDDSVEGAPDDSQGTGENTVTESDTGANTIQIPYKFRRDGVQDGRTRFPLFLQDGTKQSEREAQAELEERFEDDVSLTDLREALIIVGLDHLDNVEAQLEEWGYGMQFDD